jgi:hypothetical protein
VGRNLASMPIVNGCKSFLSLPLLMVSMLAVRTLKIDVHWRESYAEKRMILTNYSLSLPFHLVNKIL